MNKNNYEMPHCVVIRILSNVYKTMYKVCQQLSTNNSTIKHYDSIKDKLSRLNINYDKIIKLLTNQDSDHQFEKVTDPKILDSIKEVLIIRDSTNQIANVEFTQLLEELQKSFYNLQTILLNQNDPKKAIMLLEEEMMKQDFASRKNKQESQEADFSDDDVVFDESVVMSSNTNNSESDDSSESIPDDEKYKS